MICMVDTWYRAQTLLVAEAVGLVRLKGRLVVAQIVHAVSRTLPKVICGETLVH